MIDFIASLFPWRQARLAEQAGGEVARLCRADLWRRICWGVRGMSVAETRGYARAYAAGFIAAEVDQVLGRHALNPTLRARAMAWGVDQLVAMAVRDALGEAPPAEARPLAA
jgi:hypothetical protein